ncbi:MAG TPA: ABC transporter ATP-binding protein, partial [Lactobacillus sp.]|nr:ABC transporter ATP-binding protein [Lactobacillus sp.]
MKPTISLLSRQKVLTLLTTLLILIESLGKVASSLTLAPLTDQLINKNFNGVVFWLLSTITIWGITLTIGYVNSVLKAQIIRKVTNQLRTDIADGLSTVPISEYKKVNHNEYVSWLTNDVNMIEQNGLDAFFSLLGNVTTLLFAVTSLAFYHYSLALAAIILGLLTMTIPQFFSKIMT